MMVAADVSTDSKRDRRMTRVVMDRWWMNVWMDGWMDGYVGSGLVRGVGGPIVYHLRVPQNIHWKKMHMGDSLPSNLLSCLLEGRKEGEF